MAKNGRGMSGKATIVNVIKIGQESTATVKWNSNLSLSE